MSGNQHAIERELKTVDRHAGDLITACSVTDCGIAVKSPAQCRQELSSVASSVSLLVRKPFRMIYTSKMTFSCWLKMQYQEFQFQFQLKMAS